MQRNCALLGIVIGLLPTACAPKSEIAFDFDEGVGALLGTVTDAESGEVIPGAGLTIGWGYYGYSDRVGRFAVRGMRPGRYDVEVTHAWFHPETLAVDVPEGSVVRDVSLRRASHPCCDLLGEWTVDLFLDSLGGQDIQPQAREISGRIWFATDFPHPIPRLLTRHNAPGASDEIGRFDIDFEPFWGDQLAPTLSTGVHGGGPDLLTEVLGLVYCGDSVMISLVPGLSHGGIAMRGRIVADTVVGEWWQKATLLPEEDPATGRFVMRRN